MKVIQYATLEVPDSRLEFPKDACAAIGVFDGVHLGHQQVIRQTISDAHHRGAVPVAVTFDRHPAAIVAPQRVPPMIQTLAHRLETIAALGIEVACVIRFDESFSRISGAEFVRQLLRDFGRLHSICVGSAFTFGHQRSGNVALLQRMGAEHGFNVHGLAAVSLDGETISSTRIREAIRAGHLDLAGQMLGRDYTLTGPVVRGDQLGRQIGFPTANLDVAGLALPPQGVYAVEVSVDERTQPGVLNLGHRPTVQASTPLLRVEVHLLDFTGDLYDRELVVTFVQKLRDEQKFPSLDALRAQIERDIAAARRVLAT